MSDITNEAAIFVPYVQINGADIVESLAQDVSYIRVARSIGMVSHAELRIRDEDLDHGATFEIGAELVVGSVGDDGTRKPLFQGDITSMGIDYRVAGTTLIVEALDDARKLGNKISLSSDLNITASDVISRIASDANLTVTVDATTETFDSLQVYGTPLQFLDMLASRYGYEWSVDGPALSVKARAAGTSVPLTAGVDLQQFSGRVATSGLPNKVKVRGWNSASKQSIIGQVQVSASHNANRPTSDLAQQGGPPSAEGEQLLEIFSAGVPSVNEAEAMATGIARRIASMHVSGHGETLVNADVKPGGMVEISNLEGWAGNYHVTSVEHVVGDARSFTTRFTVGSSEVSGLTGMLGRPQGVTSGAQIGTGISVGIVTDIADDEGLGRVKVKIPNIADDHETFWARVVSPGAGLNRGLLTLPEVDDEVAVAFENGDIQRPYVLGGLWNDLDTLPPRAAVDGSKVATRSFTSRGGAYIEFSEDSGDAAGTRYIKLVTADESATVTIGEDKVSIEAPALPIRFENDGASIELSDSGAITITAENGDLTLDAGTNNLVVTANNIDLTADGSFTATATAAAEVTGMGVKVDGGGGITEIKGSLVKLN